MGRTPQIRLAPQLRGHVPTRLVGALGRRGWRLHRVGAAVYAHDGLHLLLGVWDRRELAPVWASQLGRPSAGYLRRLARCDRQQTGRLMHRSPDGSFVARLPWWRMPGPRVYSFEPPSPSLQAAEARRAALSRLEVRR